MLTWRGSANALVGVVLAAATAQGQMPNATREAMQVVARKLLESDPATYVVVAPLRTCPEQWMLPVADLRQAYCGTGASRAAGRDSVAAVVARAAGGSAAANAARTSSELWGPVGDSIRTLRPAPAASCKGVPYRVKSLETSHLRGLDSGAEWRVLIVKTLYAPRSTCPGALMVFELVVRRGESGHLEVVATHLISHAG